MEDKNIFQDASILERGAILMRNSCPNNKELYLRQKKKIWQYIIESNVQSRSRVLNQSTAHIQKPEPVRKRNHEGKYEADKKYQFVGYRTGV